MMKTDSPGITWLFFDLGNTLIDETKAEAGRIKSIQTACRGVGLDFTVELIYQTIAEASANYAPNIIQAAVGNLVPNLDDFQWVMSQVIYEKELEEPFADAIEVLKELHQFYSIGIIANQSLGTEQRLKSYGMWDYIDLCLSSAEIGLHKPDPEIFRTAFQKANCPPENSVMIGDRLDNDIYPAKKLGCKTVHVLRGFGRYQVPKSNEYEPDYTITELKELYASLQLTVK